MAIITVRVQPGVTRNEIVGCEGGVWRVRVTAPPIKGRANAALIELLADRLGVRKSSIAILRGLTAREKVVEIAGINDEELTDRLSSGPSTCQFDRPMCED